MPPMPQEYVAIVGNAPNAPIQAYVAVVDAQGNIVSGSYGPPGGRLTLTTLTPVLTATVSAAGTVLYTPYQSDIVPIFNGTTWLMTQFAELSNVLANSSVGNAGPVAAANNSNYDLFVWNNAGVMTLSRGPAWTSDTARSAGTGLVRVNGLLLNAVAITNGPAAQRGTYVGIIRTNGTATTDYNLGSAAAGGGAAVIGVWNCYNRVSVSPYVNDTNSGWSYTSNTIRAADNSNGNRISCVAGLSEDSISLTYSCRLTGPTGAAGASFSVALAINATNTMNLLISTVQPGVITPSGSISTPAVVVTEVMRLGFNFYQAVEQGDNVNAFTVGGNTVQGLTGILRA